MASSTNASLTNYFSKSAFVGGLYQVQSKQSKGKSRPDYDMQALNPYADGEWRKIEPVSEESRLKLNVGEVIEEEESFEKEDFNNTEDLGHHSLRGPFLKDNILRGPIWNYGIRKLSSDEHYYNNTLFGIPWASQKTPEDMILRGKKWDITEPIKYSMILFLLRKFKKLGNAKIALVELDTGRQVTYREFFEKIESLAHGLHWLGVQPEQVIAIVSFHSLEAHLMLLACLRIGAIGALVDSSLDSVDISVVFRITSPNYVFTEVGHTLFKVESAIKSLEMSLHALKPELIINSNTMPFSTNYFLLHQLFKEVTPTDRTPGPRCEDPLRPILILYTGHGATLKACLISERYYTHSMAFRASVLPENDEPSITVMITPPMYCALAIKSVFNHYNDGHRIVVCRGQIPEPNFITALRKFEVFALLTTRATLMSLLDWPAKIRCPNLKLVAVTGVPLRLKNLLRVYQRFNKQAQILELYGLVETGTTAGNTFLENKKGSVGKPFYNVEMKFLEEGTRIPLGPNQEGELCIRTPTMMLGYYNNPEANKDVFDAEGFIHTGDLAYYDEEGFLFITDQVRQLIKWRTYLISPCLIEELLMELPEVKEALVFGMYDEEDYELVSAAVIFDPGYELTDLDALKNKANALLPFHRQIRGGIYVFHQFPRSTIGKPLRDQVLNQVMNRGGSLTTKKLSLDS